MKDVSLFDLDEWFWYYWRSYEGCTLPWFNHNHPPDLIMISNCYTLMIQDEYWEHEEE